MKLSFALSKAAKTAFCLAIFFAATGDLSAQDQPVGQYYAAPLMLIAPDSEDYPNLLNQPEAVDMNADGRSDAVYSNHNPDDPEGLIRFYLLLADGQGSMELATHSVVEGDIPTTERGFRQIIPADFNGDGILDLFLESHGGEPACDGVAPPNCWVGGPNSLLLSDGNGKLVNVTGTHLPALSDFTHGSSVADFDRDGDVDIWVNNLGGSLLYNPEFSYLLDNDGQGVFSLIADTSQHVQVPITGRNEILPEGDLMGFWSFTVDAEGDGDLDLGLGWSWGLGRNIVLLNDGTGSFVLPEGESFPSPRDFGPAYIQHAVVHDLNVDGLDDVLLHQSRADASWNTAFSEPMIQVLISNGDGTFRDDTDIRYPMEVFEHASDIQLHDIDNDGHMDIFHNVAFDDGWYADVRINDGEGYFRPLDRDWITGMDWNWIVLDVDGDGGTDFLSNEWYGLVLHKMISPFGPNQDGDEEDDRLIGGAHDNALQGLGGNDVLDGGLGDDHLDGGSGNDHLIGGKGDDYLVSGTGTNIVDGGPGRDELVYAFSLDLAEIQTGESTSIRRTNGSVNDQVTGVEYAHFTNASMPLPTASESDIEGLSGIAGLWYDPALDGEGFNVITTPSGTVLFFYGYTANGQRLWLVSETFTADIGFEQVLDLAMYEGSGGTFDQPAPSSEALSEWGRLNALFEACGSARLALSGKDGVKTTYQAKLAGITDADCQAKQLLAPSGLAGLWYDAELDGEGFNVIITNGSAVFFFYGYDAAGERLWLVSETLPGVPQFGEAAMLTVYAASGGTFDTPKPSALALSEWGELQVTFNTCTGATAILTGSDGEKTSSLVKLAGITDSTCPQ
jgi:hypothetical protein